MYFQYHFRHTDGAQADPGLDLHASHSFINAHGATGHQKELLLSKGRIGWQSRMVEIAANGFHTAIIYLGKRFVHDNSGNDHTFLSFVDDPSVMPLLHSTGH
jgi:hypothetical protein